MVLNEPSCKRRVKYRFVFYFDGVSIFDLRIKCWSIRNSACYHRVLNVFMKYSKGLVWILSSLKSSLKFLIFRGLRPKHSFCDIWNLWIRMLTDLTFSLLVVISPANINKRCKGTPPPHNKTHICFSSLSYFRYFDLKQSETLKDYQTFLNELHY